MSAGEYLLSKREGGFVAEQKSVYSVRPPKLSARWLPEHPPMPINCLNNKGTWPYLAEIPKDMVDQHSVSKAVYTAINPDVAKRRATSVTTTFCRKPHG